MVKRGAIAMSPEHKYEYKLVHILRKHTYTHILNRPHTYKIAPANKSNCIKYTLHTLTHSFISHMNM